MRLVGKNKKKSGLQCGAALLFISRKVMLFSGKSFPVFTSYSGVKFVVVRTDVFVVAVLHAEAARNSAKLNEAQPLI